MFKKITLQVGQEYQGERLDQFLAKVLPSFLKQDLSKSLIRKWIVIGAVYLNRKRVRIASKKMIAKAIIFIYLDLDKLENPSKFKNTLFSFSQDGIIYEDDFLIAVNKPTGLPTQPTLDNARLHLFGLVKQFLAQREGKEVSEVYLGLHHRLDRDTSGLVLFTKNQSANPGIAKIFAEHRLEKVYQALVLRIEQHKMLDAWSVKNYLNRIELPKKKKISRYGSTKSGGKYAETSFRLLRQTKTLFWVEARPITGRTHQIRVHLSEAGFPVCGDFQYGKDKNQPPRMMLHAFCLRFLHPIFETEVVIESPLPQEFTAWFEKS